jgi:arylsulfatase A-like enzyme
MLYPQETDGEYRRLYQFLQVLVDAAIMRILDELEARGLADDTIVVFTSDHGDMLGAHGGMMQKWHNAYDEAVRVPMLVSGPGVDASAPGIEIATSHVDLVPTLLGLVGADVEAAAAEVSRHHVETQPLVGRDLSPLLAGSVDDDVVDAPVYFMTEDEISRGLNMQNLFTHEVFEPIDEPGKVESIITRLPTGDGGTVETWKLNHYYERLPQWEEAHGLANPFAPEPADAQWELHNLTLDPEERANRAADADTASVLAQLRSVLDDTRESMRRTPQHVNART